MGTHYSPRPLGNARVPAIASGGTETVIEQDGKYYRVHTFTDVGSDTLEVTRPGKVECLIVAGGGGGGGCVNRNAGGGGAGGVVLTKTILSSSENVLVSVGHGGSKGPDGSSPGSNGADSHFNLIIAKGGGGGGGAYSGSRDTRNDGRNGGSGGGLGGISSAGNVIGLSVQEGTNSKVDFEFGNNGGGGEAQGGGGGAGSSGTGGLDTAGFGGFGGSGIMSSISGVEEIYGGGGDAVNYNQTSDTQDGATPYRAVAMPNLGSGGSATDNGARSENSLYGIGGSGVVIVRYRITKQEFDQF